MNVLDTRVGMDLQDTLEFSMHVAVPITAAGIVNPLMLVVATFLMTAFECYARIFLVASRQLNKLENCAKGPIIEHFDGYPLPGAMGRLNDQSKSFKTRSDDMCGPFGTCGFSQSMACFPGQRYWCFFVSIYSSLGRQFAERQSFYGWLCHKFYHADITGYGLIFRCYANFEQDMSSVDRVHSLSTINTESYDGSIPRIDGLCRVGWMFPS
jgi:hypothetical protein